LRFETYTCQKKNREKHKELSAKDKTPKKAGVLSFADSIETGEAPAKHRPAKKEAGLPSIYRQA
jgi:hypothetical protein